MVAILQHWGTSALLIFGGLIRGTSMICIVRLYDTRPRVVFVVVLRYIRRRRLAEHTRRTRWLRNDQEYVETAGMFLPGAFRMPYAGRSLS